MVIKKTRSEKSKNPDDETFQGQQKINPTCNSKSQSEATSEEQIDDDWPYFDDCPICQAMKNGTADTAEGLLEAFKEAKKKYPDRVGGTKEFEEWVKEEK